MNFIPKSHSRQPQYTNVVKYNLISQRIQQQKHKQRKKDAPLQKSNIFQIYEIK